MAIDIYLYFNGNTREAVTYYAEIFDIPLAPIMTYGEAHEDTDFEGLLANTKDLVMHTFLELNGTKIMFSDAHPGMKVNIGNNIALTYLSSAMEDIERIFQGLAKDGTVEMELQETFWTKRYGTLTDRFGIPWMFSYSETSPHSNT